MPFSRRFYPKRLTVMCAYILRMGGPGDRTHYPGVTSAMLYQLSYRRTTDNQVIFGCDALVPLLTSALLAYSVSLFPNFF